MHIGNQLDALMLLTHFSLARVCMPKLGQAIKGHVVQIVNVEQTLAHMCLLARNGLVNSQICSQKVVRANEIAKLYVEL